ncbi:branched-chain amino acid ABC transporter permease [Embleya hyalina]|uniref:Branched-chain amino acid ABC transporter permease/ATP-binding protein n=1 Tax=Embleya hyalina TaxID=516124 RepID=A0A401Z6A4_9ACTN|nr:ABC transporter permease [Embleya hyalina]GCE02369.1 branched-chain amino acid ABC transporter permease/ATP-binding protein [Embleya hyalina]
MHEFIILTISGLVTGGIYAITAGGLTLTYTTTGIFNFAHGATGALAAFTYWQLHFDWGWPVWLSLLVVLGVLAPAFGVFLHFAIMRRLEGTSETTRLMVTVAVLLSLLAAVMWIWDPQTPRNVVNFFPGESVDMAGTRVSYHDLITLAVALIVAIGLWVLLRSTRAGVAMRATVDDRNLAVLNGSRPEVPGMLAWATGTMLAAVAGILIAPKLSFAALPLTLLIVNAYAAAVIGRLKSLPWTFVGAMIIGLVTEYGKGYLTETRFPTAGPYLSGLSDSMPVLVLFVAIMLLPTSRLRGHASSRTREISHRPTWTGSLVFAGIVIAGAVVAANSLAAADLFASTRMWGFALIGLSVIPLVGYAGKMSLAQLGFAGIGAICVSHLGEGGNPLGLLWAALICAGIGVLVALPALRLSGIYLALATAAFAVMLDRWIFGLPAFTWGDTKIDLFNSGTLNFERFDWPGIDISSDRAYFIFGAVFFALSSLVVVWIRRGEFGRRLLAMKDSPAACATIGMNHKLTTLTVFGLSAAMAGVGGGILGGAAGTLSPVNFDFTAGLSVLMLMVIAGLTSPGAALFAGIFLGTPLMTNLFPDYAQLTTILIGLNGIALGKNPNGFIAAKIRPEWEPALGRPVVLAGSAAAQLALIVLRFTDVIGNWPFVLGILLAVIGIPAALKIEVMIKAPRTEPEVPEGLSGQPEGLGLNGNRFEAADIEALDKLIALPSLPAAATAAAPSPILPGARHGA